MLKNYLKLNNISFLFGSSTSIHLGAVAIRNFPIELEVYIKEKDKDIPRIIEEFFSVIKQIILKILLRIKLR